MIPKKCKRFIKARLRSLLKRDTDYIKRQIDAADVVSFDLFDTLVSRRGKTPESVFEFLEDELKRAGKYPDNRSFYKDRCSIENNLRKKSSKEITLDQIYTSFSWLLEDEREEIKKKETVAEIEEAYMCKEGQLLFEYAISNNKEIVITSDMYLPIDVITDIVKKTGYEDWSKIYLSSEYGITKDKGLFNTVKKDFEGKVILHIGDDIKNDYRAAKKYGLCAALL